MSMKRAFQDDAEYTGGSSASGPSSRKCTCGLPCKVWKSKKEATAGKEFFGCPNYRGPSSKGCGYFQWVEEPKSNQWVEDPKSNDRMKVMPELGVLVEKMDEIILYLKIVVILGVLAFGWVIGKFM